MEWYWVIIAASIGLLIGCMCRVSGRADEWAGLKGTEKHLATGGIVKLGKLVYYPDSNIDLVPMMMVQPTFDLVQDYSKTRINPIVVSVKPKIVNYERDRRAAKSAVKLISMIYKTKREKFRWKNYYKALKVMGRAVNVRKRSKAS